MIVAAVRESENEPLLRQSGADHVAVSSAAAGRLLGLSTIDPAREACTGLIAVLRGDNVLAVDDPRAGRVEDGDRLVLASVSASGPAQR